MTEIVEIVQPSGQLDENNINLLNNEIIAFLKRGVKLILIDFQDITSIDYESVAHLKVILQNVRNHGGAFYICSLNEQVQTIFEITHTKEIFNPLKNRQEFEEKILASNLKFD